MGNSTSAHRRTNYGGALRSRSPPAYTPCLSCAAHDAEGMMNFAAMRRHALAWVTLDILLYVLAALPLAARLGPSIGPFSAAPVALAAALFG